MYFQSLDYIHYAGPDGYPQVGAGTAGGTGGFYGMFNYFLGLSTSGIRDFNFTTWFRPAVATPTKCDQGSFFNRLGRRKHIVPGCNNVP
jgi:hypothetical protein